ncbi:MAG: hypothetical protein ACPGLV_04415 [Bacteroidia bacterium]
MLHGFKEKAPAACPLGLRLRRCEWSKGLPKRWPEGTFGSGYAWLLLLKINRLKPTRRDPQASQTWAVVWVFCGFLELAENSGKKDKGNCHERKQANEKHDKLVEFTEQPRGQNSSFLDL